MCKQSRKSSTKKIGEHIPCEYSMSIVWQTDHTESKHNLYRGNDCMKSFREYLKEHAKKMVLKRKNVTVKKRRNKITSRYNKLLNSWKKNLKKAC